jgi:hypothetical protein
MAFTLKGAFSKVASAFETVWADLKVGAVDTANFITTQGATIVADTGEVGAVVSAAIPGASGAVSAIEALESKVMSIVLTGANEIMTASAGNAPQTVAALKALGPQLLAAAEQLAVKPAVASANAAGK